MDKFTISLPLYKTESVRTQWVCRHTVLFIDNSSLNCDQHWSPVVDQTVDQNHFWPQFKIQIHDHRSLVNIWNFFDHAGLPCALGMHFLPLFKWTEFVEDFERKRDKLNGKWWDTAFSLKLVQKTTRQATGWSLHFPFVFFWATNSPSLCIYTGWCLHLWLFVLSCLGVYIYLVIWDDSVHF